MDKMPARGARLRFTLRQPSRVSASARCACAAVLRNEGRSRRSANGYERRQLYFVPLARIQPAESARVLHRRILDVADRSKRSAVFTVLHLRFNGAIPENHGIGAIDQSVAD